MTLIQPAMQGLDFMDDLEAVDSDGKQNASPICDEAHLQIFAFWYQMGGLQRPLTPVEAAETPAPLAMDFVYLLRRLQRLNESRTGLDRFVEERRASLYGKEQEHGGGR